MTARSEEALELEAIVSQLKSALGNLKSVIEGTTSKADGLPIVRQLIANAKTLINMNQEEENEA